MKKSRYERDTRPPEFDDGRRPPLGLLRVQQAASYLGVSERQVRYLVEREGLPFVPVTGRVRRFRTEDLDAWVASRVCQFSTSQPQRAASTGAASPSTRYGTVSAQELAILEELRPKPKGSTPKPRSVAVRLPGGASITPLPRRR